MGAILSRKPIGDELTTQSLIVQNFADTWFRLSLGNNKHGAQAMRDLLIKDFKIQKDGKLLHSWIEKALRKRSNIFPPYVLKNLLGQCQKGCNRPCNEETYLENLDITSLAGIFNKAEIIIPSDVLSADEIKKLKEKYQKHVNSLTAERNNLAHDTYKEKIQNNEFETRWTKIRNTLKGMDYDEIQSFDDLKSCPLDSNVDLSLIHI